MNNIMIVLSVFCMYDKVVRTIRFTFARKYFE